MRTLLTFCLNNRLLTAIVTALLCGGSYMIVKSLPVDVFPEIEVSRVTIQTEAAGLTAEEVEQWVTIPIESAMSGLAGARQTRSSSGSGLSFVWVDFAPGFDTWRARQTVAERLATLDLPPGAAPEVAPIVSVAGEILLIALTAEGENPASPTDLRMTAEYTLRNRLLAIPGVGQVVVLGGSLPEYQINIDPARLRQHNLTLDHILNAATAAQSTATAGYLPDSHGLEIPLRQLGRITSLDDLKTAPIPGAPAPTRLQDATQVTLGGAPRRGSAHYGPHPAVILSIQKAPGGNTLSLTREIDRTLDSFQAATLPPGMKIHRDAYRQADFITLSMHNGRDILIEATLIVILVLFLTLWNIRTALITLIAMPLSLLFALALFPPLNLGINIMTLGGLAVAVGDVVDNAVIFVENAWRNLTRNAHLPPPTRLTRKHVLIQTSREVIHAATFSTLIILLVFLPLVCLSGIEGQFFRPLGIAYILALAASLLIAITLVPLACLLFFKEPRATAQPHREPASVRLIKRLYTPLLTLSTRYYKTTCLLALLLTAATLTLAATFGASFLPPFHEDCYTVFISTVPGTSLAETERLTQHAAQAIATLPGVKTVTRRTGRAERDEHAEPVSASEILVRVDLNRDQTQLRQEINRIITAIPGAATMIGYPMAHRISAILSGTNAEVALNIFGDDLPTLRAATAKAKAIIDTLPQVADAQANREILVDSLCIRYRNPDLLRHNLTREDAGRQVAAAFNGITTGQVAQNQYRWDIVIRLTENHRRTPQDIATLRLTAPDGSTPRLDEIADIFPEPTSNLIIRDNTRRKALISCNPAPGANIGDLVDTLRQHVEPAINALGCTVTYGGTYEARLTAARQLQILGGAIFLLILLILTFALKKFRFALLILINIPLALIGGILAIRLSTPVGASPILSVASLVGFVTLFGFAIRNGLLLLNRYLSLEDTGHPPLQAIRHGSLERVTPIIMTSLTTILGLWPIVIAQNTPGGELLAPLAIVQFGGMISATLLNLLILPAAYHWLRSRA